MLQWTSLQISLPLETIQETSQYEDYSSLNIGSMPRLSSIVAIFHVYNVETDAKETEGLRASEVELVLGIGLHLGMIVRSI